MASNIYHYKNCSIYIVNSSSSWGWKVTKIINPIGGETITIYEDEASSKNEGLLAATNKINEYLNNYKFNIVSSGSISTITYNKQKYELYTDGNQWGYFIPFFASTIDDITKGFSSYIDAQNAAKAKIDSTNSEWKVKSWDGVGCIVTNGTKWGVRYFTDDDKIREKYTFNSEDEAVDAYNNGWTDDSGSSSSGDSGDSGSSSSGDSGSSSESSNSRFDSDNWSKVGEYSYKNNTLLIYEASETLKSQYRNNKYVFGWYVKFSNDGNEHFWKSDISSEDNAILKGASDICNTLDDTSSTQLGSSISYNKSSFTITCNGSTFGYEISSLNKSEDNYNSYSDAVSSAKALIDEYSGSSSTDSDSSSSGDSGSSSSGGSDTPSSGYNIYVESDAGYYKYTITYSDGTTENGDGYETYDAAEAAAEEKAKSHYSGSSSSDIDGYSEYEGSSYNGEVYYILIKDDTLYGYRVEFTNGSTTSDTGFSSSEEARDAAKKAIDDSTNSEGYTEYGSYISYNDCVYILLLNDTDKWGYRISSDNYAISVTYTGLSSSDDASTAAKKAIDKLVDDYYNSQDLEEGTTYKDATYYIKEDTTNYGTFNYIIKYTGGKTYHMGDFVSYNEAENAAKDKIDELASQDASGDSDSDTSSSSSNSSSSSSSNSSSSNSNSSKKKSSKKSSSSDSNDDSGDNSTDDGVGKFISKPIRKAIKIMARVAHIANAISQMPQPKDFALMITSDVVYMSGKVQEITKNLNTLLESYTDIPFDYLETQLNGVMNTATDILNKVDNYATSNINEVMDFANNTVKMPTELINTSIDIYSSASEMVKNVSSNVKIASASLNGKTEKATKLKSDLANAIKKIKSKNASDKKDATKALTQASDAITKAQKDATGFVTDKTSAAKNFVNDQYKQIQNWIEKIKDYVQDFSKSVDKCFGVSASSSSAAVSSLNTVAGITTTAGDNEFDKLATTVVSEAAKTASSILQNFSIGKFVTACGGMTASVILVQTGLDKLPPINTQKIMSAVNGVKKNLTESKIDFDDLVKYSPEAYNKYKEQYEEVLNEQRNKIHEKMANKKKKSNLLAELKAENKARKEYLKKLKNGDYQGQSTDELKSGLKQIRKKRKQARKGKRVNKLKDTILAQLKKFAKELKSLLNSVKSKWTSMMANYKKTVKEIKKYFSKSSGGGNDTIERICDDMEQNITDIVRICTIDLPVQMAQVNVNVNLPRAIGMCAPNFVQHIVQWFADIKVILKFIMDLIRYIMNVIKDINQLVTIIVNGIKSAGEIFKKLMSLIGLSWLIGLIDKIQNQFGSLISNTVQLLENSLETVYFKDTDDYEKLTEAIDNLLELELPEGQDMTSYVNNIYSYVAGNHSLSSSIKSTLSYDLANKIYNGTATDDDLETLEDKLEDMENVIVAYRSVVFKRDEDGNYLYSSSDENTAASQYLQTTTVNIPEIQKYIYYHPDLYHYDASCFGGLFPKARRKRKAKFIKKAAKKSNKTNGGVNMLKKKTKLFKNHKTGSCVSAYDAFYWYEVYTDDTDLDWYGTDNTETSFSKVVFNTKTGSVVLIDLGNGNTQKVFVENTNVQSGDYVTYNGKKYKIK